MIQNKGKMTQMKSCGKKAEFIFLLIKGM